MYGHVLLIIRDFIINSFSTASWDIIVEQCSPPLEIKDNGIYSDEMIDSVISTTLSVLSLQRDQFLMMLGEQYLEKIREKHDLLLRNLGDSMLAFIQNLDYIHTYIQRDYPQLNMPSFRCEADSMADNMVVHYYSSRDDLYPLAEGILQSVARIYFNSDLQVTILSRSQEQVSADGPPRQHVVFKLKVTKIKPKTEAPPTFLAFTQKGIEKPVLKTDVDRVIERLKEIKDKEGEAALPVNKSKVARAKWRSLAKMSLLCSGFAPQYPVSLNMTTKAFCSSFPYHVVFDREMRVVHSGVKVQELLPSIRDRKPILTHYLLLLHPVSVSFTFENVAQFINTPFITQTLPAKMTKTWNNKPMVKFRGQMVSADDEHIIYLCSPYVRNLHDLEDWDMKLADIPIHDVTRDLLWIEMMPRTKQKQIGSAGSECRAALVVPSDRSDDISSDDPLVLRKLVMMTRQQCAEERKRNDDLMRAFLPPSYKLAYGEGHRDLAAKYKSATVLFSDVVSFAQILNCCTPNQVVMLLAELHQEFNRVCKVHQTFRVEAIGDAYMVVSGAPEEIQSHPERIANTALGMLIAAKEVACPYDYNDATPCVKIRIGLCTGPVTCGMVGDVTPRCLVFGPAVNMASRLESHGMEGKVHVNQETRDILQQRGFLLEKRGNIDLRGLGRIKTYFLVRNVRATEEHVMGRRLSRGMRTANGVDVTFINDGRVELPPNSSGTNGSDSPLLHGNKVAPSTAMRMNLPRSVRSSMSGGGGESIVVMSYSDNP